MNKKLVNRIEKLFLNKIAKNPTWGKNQIELLFKESVTQAVLEYVDDLETPKETKMQKLPWNPIKDIDKYKAAKGEVSDAEEWFNKTTEQDTFLDDNDIPPFDEGIS